MLAVVDVGGGADGLTASALGASVGLGVGAGLGAAGISAGIDAMEVGEAEGGSPLAPAVHAVMRRQSPAAAVLTAECRGFIDDRPRNAQNESCSEGHHVERPRRVKS